MVSRFTVQWMLHFLCGSRSTSTRGASFISLRCLATWSQFPPLGMFRRGLGTRGEDLKVRFARGRKLDLHLSEMTDMRFKRFNSTKTPSTASKWLVLYGALLNRSLTTCCFSDLRSCYACFGVPLPDFLHSRFGKNADSRLLFVSRCAETHI